MKNTFLTLLVFIVCIKVSFVPSLRIGSVEKPVDTNEQPALEQAKKLLRTVNPVGSLTYGEAEIGSDFASLIGSPVQITRDQLRSYITANNISESEIGGRLDANVSFVADTAGVVHYARYFVIHDTSFPRYGNNDFPADINEETWKFNNFDHCWNMPVTHVFVNRVGRSKTVTDFDTRLTATKMEKFVLGEQGRGLYLHVELIQPRKRNKRYWKHNDIECPTPGFSDLQYKRLALLYVTASVRKGEWMIPAFHANVDQGIHDSHDDPQGFDLNVWQSKIKEVVAEINQKSDK